MSEFFNVTLDKDIVLDDSGISKNMTWSSDKILREIIAKRLTKFEELEDVDVANKKDKQLIAFSASTGKFTTIDGTEAGEITGTGLRQISKMGIVGSHENPRVVNISINTIDFKVPRVNVLKYDTSNTQDIISTKNEFKNGESNDFEEDKYIEFDGKAHLKTEYNQEYKVIEDTENYIEFETEIDLDEFKFINGFEDFEDGVIRKININAIPYDRLLIPKGDMNLSNVEHIDYFKLIATGSNIRVVCSVDSGVTWKAFKTDKWINVELELNDVKNNGMTVELFNSINDVFWNELVASKKIRFAYLFSMNGNGDIEELDKLDLQFDGQGKWIQVKENNYDVVYASNTLLEIYLKESGDFKINY